VFLIVVLICKKDSVRSQAVKMFQLQRAALSHWRYFNMYFWASLLLWIRSNSVLIDLGLFCATSPFWASPFAGINYGLFSVKGWNSSCCWFCSW